DGASAISLVRQLKPDAALLEAAMPGLSGVQAARSIVREQLAAVVILAETSEQRAVGHAAAAGAGAYLIKPVNERKLLAAIELAVSRFRAACALRSHIRELRDEVEMGRLLQRAKAVIMEELGVCESDASERLETLAEKSGRTLKEA